MRTVTSVKPFDVSFNVHTDPSTFMSGCCGYKTLNAVRGNRSLSSVSTKRFISFRVFLFSVSYVLHEHLV